METRDERLASELTARCQEARTTLQKHMAVHGLRAQDGWRIEEFTRQIEGRTELVMRPIHRTLTPPDLECVCMIDEPGSNISAECRS